MTLHKCQPNEAVVHSDEEIISSDEDEESIESHKKNVIDPGTKNETTFLDLMQLLSNHDLHTAFPNLFLAYQGLYILPHHRLLLKEVFLRYLVLLNYF